MQIALEALVTATFQMPSRGRGELRTRLTEGWEQDARIGKALSDAADLLGTLPQASPRLEAELLLSDATGTDRAKLMAWPQAKIAEQDMECFQALVQRRLAGEPIAYIRGHQAFWTLDLRVTQDTLIPRPETELLVELALEQLAADASLVVLDAGCGSGAIACALASERPSWVLIATDQSMGATRIAQENLSKCAPGHAVVISCDWLVPIAERSLSAIIANPPYVPDKDPHLQLGDLRWEPRHALIAGADGLDAIRSLSLQAASRLRHGGFFALEHGFDQGHAVREILARQGFEAIHTHRDLSGLERATTGLLTDRTASPGLK